ncbi:hypothetical protein L1987_74926 [Smallanthus sonchifolius]|uniref:Uncharacterized protein n=1 Tax=Smallanthus sonchifolius TaxID=185202 RepID=A0ACB9A3B3_9ASTR|nr:hypothetical protein L1987_74926 [Smallanthus sonchifolius]
MMWVWFGLFRAVMVRSGVKIWLVTAMVEERDGVDVFGLVTVFEEEVLEGVGGEGKERRLGEKKEEGGVGGRWRWFLGRSWVTLRSLKEDMMWVWFGLFRAIMVRSGVKIWLVTAVVEERDG